jgi:phosphoglycerate kinase
VNEIDGPKLSVHPLDAFGSLEDLDCRGRRVFLRVDPYLLDTLDDADAESPAPPPAHAEPGAPEALESSRVAFDRADPRRFAGGPFAPGPFTPLAAPAPAPATATLKRLLELEARVVIATHFTPEARAETGLDGVDALATRLSERLGVEVFMPDECVGDAAVRVINELRQGQLCVLPDLVATRDGEQNNDEAFARALASSMDAYVFEAFSASHLEYASTVRLPRLLPRRALGQRARRELGTLSSVFSLNRGSVGLALGGHSFADKIDTLGAWLPRVDRLCIGGAVATTLLCAAGRAAPEASPEPDRLAQARSLIARARDLGVAITLPVDFVVQLEGDQGTLVKRPADLPARARIVDIGPESIRLFSEVLGKAKHLLWWGPLGDLRHPEGTQASRALAALCARPEIMSVAIGGDTRRFVRQLGPELSRGLDLVSTGSLAARALLAGRRLPGIESVRTRR